MQNSKRKYVFRNNQNFTIYRTVDVTSSSSQTYRKGANFTQIFKFIDQNCSKLNTFFPKTTRILYFHSVESPRFRSTNFRSVASLDGFVIWTPPWSKMRGKSVLLFFVDNQSLFFTESKYRKGTEFVCLGKSNQNPKFDEVWGTERVWARAR